MDINPLVADEHGIAEEVDEPALARDPARNVFRVLETTLRVPVVTEP